MIVDDAGVMTIENADQQAMAGATGPVQRLAEERNAWLCTLRRDGPPHVTPIWFVWFDDAFWLCSNSDSVKARNARRDARVALALEDGDRPIVAEGQVTIHPRPYPSGVVGAFARKFGWDINEPDEEGDWDALFEVRVTRWLMGGPR